MPNPNEVATLTTGGETFSNWKTVMVRRDFGAPSSEFSFSSVEPGSAGKGWAGMRFKPFDPVQVKLAGIQVIEGSVTTRSTSMDAQGHEIMIQGRSRVCSIVDSSVPIKPGTFSGQTYEQVARGLLAPHGIGLVVRNPPPIFTKPFKSLVPQYGETFEEMLGRMAAMRGVFHVDDAQGNLVVGQGNPSAAPVATLQEGVNIKSISCRLDNQNAWSVMSTIGQNVGDDYNHPPRDYSGSSVDATVPDTRKKIMMAPHPGDSDEMTAHTNHARAVATWNIVQCTIIVQGWLRPDSKLWDTCDNVSVKSPSAFPNEDGFQTLGIQSVTFSQDNDNGTTTTLTCVLPNALASVQALNPQPSGNADPTSGSALGTAKPDPSDTD